MSTRKETVEFILDHVARERRGSKLGKPRFHVRAMFGEYALYCDPTSSKGSGEAKKVKKPARMVLRSKPGGKKSK